MWSQPGTRVLHRQAVSQTRPVRRRGLQRSLQYRAGRRKDRLGHVPRILCQQADHGPVQKVEQSSNAEANAHRTFENKNENVSGRYTKYGMR